MKEDLNNLVYGQDLSCREFCEISSNGKTSVADASLHGFVEAQVLVPVVIDNSPDDVSFPLLQLRQLYIGIILRQSTSCIRHHQHSLVD